MEGRCNEMLALVDFFILFQENTVEEVHNHECDNRDANCQRCPNGLENHNRNDRSNEAHDHFHELPAIALKIIECGCRFAHAVDGLTGVMVTMPLHGE